jgi:hypothetical protein
MIDSCPEGSFIPSSILLKCFHLWENFGYVLLFSSLLKLIFSYIYFLFLEVE